MWLRARLLRIDRIMGLVRARTESYACKYMCTCVQQTGTIAHSAFESLMTAPLVMCVFVCSDMTREVSIVVRRSERSSNYEIHT